MIAGEGSKHHLEGAELDLPPRYVQALGMTVQEHATNAAGYRTLSTVAGLVDVGWNVVMGGSDARHLVMR